MVHNLHGVGFRSQTRSLHGNSYLLPYGRQELHLTCGLSRPLFERIIQIRERRKVSSLLAMQLALFPLQFGEELLTVHTLATL
jgi:hypothetical protein